MWSYMAVTGQTEDFDQIFLGVDIEFARRLPMDRGATIVLFPA